MVKFELIQKEIKIFDESNRKIIWQGKPFGCSVKKIIAKPGLSDCIILLSDYEFSLSEYRGLGNLMLLTNEGKIKWHAEIPESSDSYVDIHLENEKLYANSWLGYLVQINPKDGKLLNKEFTK